MKHWLFTLKDGYICSVRYDDQKNEYDFLLVGGQNIVRYEENYWDKWSKNSGFYAGDGSTCYVCGNISVPDDVRSAIGNSFWTPNRIQAAFQLIEPAYQQAGLTPPTFTTKTSAAAKAADTEKKPVPEQKKIPAAEKAPEKTAEPPRHTVPAASPLEMQVGSLPDDDAPLSPFDRAMMRGKPENR